MTTTARKMFLSCVVASTLVAMVTAANEYLPPNQNKGYTYEPPIVPFPTTSNGVKQPSPGPGPFRPPPPSYVPPPPGPGPQNPPSGHQEDHHHHEPGMPFNFSYSVNENDNKYSHNAISDGDVTRGEYRVALPDGRTQIVKYTADWKNGFNAEVTYEGEAKYLDLSQGYGTGPAPGPAPGPGQAYIPPSQGGGYRY